jgi:hypothetical protein
MSKWGQPESAFAYRRLTPAVLIPIARIEKHPIIVVCPCGHDILAN